MKVPVRALLCALLLAVAYAPSLIEHAKAGFDLLTFNDDARQQIFPFFRYQSNGPVGPDLAGDYQLALMPVGYRALFRFGTAVADPDTLSTVLPYVLFGTMLVAVGMTARALGGGAAACLSLALSLQSTTFLARMAGALPRSFAFTLLALGFWALAVGRVRLLAVMVVVASAVYPVAAMTLGLALSGLLFLVPQPDRGEAVRWSARKRLATLAAVTALSAIPMALVARESTPWGRWLGPGDTIAYPEVGPSGRYAEPDMIPQNRNPLTRLIPELRRHSEATFISDVPWEPRLRALVGPHTPLLAWLLAILTLAGTVTAARRNAAIRRALMLPLAGLFGYILGTLAAPYLHLPQRYLAYTIPICLIVLLPVASGALAQGLTGTDARKRRARIIGMAMAVVVGVLILGGTVDPFVGYPVRVDPGVRTYDFIRSLPRTALIAGWPRGALDNVPYLARRRVLINQENHQVFHEEYTLEARRRAKAVFAALFSPDLADLRYLRDSMGVTHLIVDTLMYAGPPQYFAPLGADARVTWSRGHDAGFAVRSVLGRAAVFRENSLVILDLSRF